MIIATVGTGGIGGYLAVKLIKAGYKVANIARGKHLNAIRKNGLRLKKSNITETVTPWISTDRPENVGKVDFIIFGVKGDSLHEAADLCSDLVHSDSVIIPFLNGVEASDRLLKFFPEKNVANGLAQVSTTVTEPGVIEQTGDFANFIFAERDSSCSTRIKALREAMITAGLNAPDTDDIDRDLWEKFVMFSAMSGITAAARVTLGQIIGSPNLKDLFISVMKETAELGRAYDIHLHESLELKIWERILKLPSNVRASTAIDLEKGLPLEIEWISGAVKRLAKKVNLNVPLNSTIYALLSPYKNGQNNISFDIIQ